VYQGNIRFLIIIGILLFPAIIFFIWNYITGKSEYQKILNKRRKEVNKK